MRYKELKEKVEAWGQKYNINTLNDVEKQTETIARDVLKRTWGFGKKRQDDFLNAFNYQVECIRSKHVTLEEIKDMLEEE